MVSKTGPVVEPLSAEVVKFAEQYGLLGIVEKVIHAARESYSDAEAIGASLQRDPEFDYLYADVHVTLNPAEEPETEPVKYYDCLGKWILDVPPELGEKIRLTTSWAKQ